jgi:hypothetical protein
MDLCPTSVKLKPPRPPPRAPRSELAPGLTWQDGSDWHRRPHEHPTARPARSILMNGADLGRGGAVAPH